MIKYQNRFDKPGRGKLLQNPGPKGALLLPAVIVAAVSFAVYFNALFDGFVFDDKFQVVDNRWIKDFRYIPEMFSKHAWGFSSRVSNYYRPLMHLLYSATYALFGLQPWGFHLVNILFHTANSVLVFIITSRLLKQSTSGPYTPVVEKGGEGGIEKVVTGNLSSPPFIAALLFAVHPVHTEAVTWVAGITEISFTFFSLLSFYCYIRAEEGFTAVRTIFSVAFFCLAALCKETALILPGIFLMYDLAYKKSGNALPALIKRYIPYLAVMAGYFLLRFLVLGAFAPEKGHDDFSGKLSLYEYVINVFPLFMVYLKKLLLPVDLKGWYVFHPITSLLELKGFVPLLGSIAFAVFSFAAWRKNRAVFFGLSLLVIPLLPVFYLPAIAVPFAERYLYLPSFGFVLLVAFFINAVPTGSRARFPLAMFLLAVIASYSVGTVQRNTVWTDNYTFWTDTVRKSPDGFIPRYNLGVELLARGRTDEAIDQFQAALRLAPDFLPAHNNLGAAYARKGLIDEAIEELRIAIKLDPESADAHNNLGSALGEKGLSDKAMEQFRIALSLNPAFADAHNNLGISYLKLGDFDKALTHFEEAVRLNPYHTSYRANLNGVNEVKRFREGSIMKNEKH